MSEELVVGLVSVSDRAAAGVYQDEGIPALKGWLASAIAAPAGRDETRLSADEQALIESTLCDLVDVKGCSLVLTTGGTGPAPRWHARGDEHRQQGAHSGRRPKDAQADRADMEDVAGEHGQ